MHIANGAIYGNSRKTQFDNLRSEEGHTHRDRFRPNRAIGPDEEDARAVEYGLIVGDSTDHLLEPRVTFQAVSARQSDFPTGF